MLVLSHRGYHVQLPENTLEAFAAAVKIGVDGIETDLRLTADGHLILFHDRLAPDGRAVSEVTTVNCGLLVSHRPTSGLESPAASRRQRINTIVWNFEFLDQAAAQSAAEAGHRNFCYGVSTVAEHVQVRQWGLDGIITDRPELALG